MARTHRRDPRAYRNRYGHDCDWCRWNRLRAQAPYPPPRDATRGEHATYRREAARWRRRIDGR